MNRLVRACIRVPLRRALRADARPILQRRRYGSQVEMDPAVLQWCHHSPTSVTLSDLKQIGLDKNRRLEHGVFLHRELKIRLAQRVLELSNLPHGLPEREGIRDVIQWYTDFLLDLEYEQPPTTQGDDERFTGLLTNIFEEHSEVIQAMAAGVQDLMADLGEDYEKVQPEVDRILRRFFIARIGMRFLIQHHINSQTNRPGHSGILQLECSPAHIAKKAAKDSMALCRAHLGQSPLIVVSENAPETFTYVPMHIQYMLTEVFKNACRAVVETHAKGGFDDFLPHVRCQIVHGHEDVTIKISDEGGGIDRRVMRNIWKFMYSTYKKSPWSAALRGKKPSSADSIANPLQRQKAGGVLAGYGVGLSLSKLYAQYFGGDLVVVSMDGYGTDVYLHLSRLGNHCENLPEVVLQSPSMRDSSLVDADNEGVLLMSAEEEAYLRQELASIRRAKGGRLTSQDAP